MQPPVGLGCPLSPSPNGFLSWEYLIPGFGPGTGDEESRTTIRVMGGAERGRFEQETFNDHRTCC